MNSREQEVKKKYEEQGWRMLRGGSPDFVAIRVDPEGNVLEFKGVEVKSENANLSYEQAIYRKLFALASIPYVVEVVSTHPIHSTPGQANPFQSTPLHPIPNQPRPSQAIPNQSRPGHSKPLQPNPAQSRPRHSTRNQTKPAQPTPNRIIPDQATPAQTNPAQTRPLQTQPIQIKGGL